jgi:hypothetical protein
MEIIIFRLNRLAEPTVELSHMNDHHAKVSHDPPFLILVLSDSLFDAPSHWNYSSHREVVAYGPSSKLKPCALLVEH